ncbi:MAG: matrixin family metalloprotease [Vicinamibacterales bacterium]
MPAEISPARGALDGRLVLLAYALIVGVVLYAVVSAQRSSALAPLDGSGRVTYFIAEGRPESQYRPQDRALATWALRAWERSAGGALRFEPSPEQDALVRLRWVNAGDGQYGEMRPLYVNGRRGAEVFVRPDTDGLGGEMARLARTDPLMRDTIVYLTCVHELGHALGLNHTDDFRDIMYFFGFGGDIPGFFHRYRAQLNRREDIAGVSGLSAGDIDRVSALYGGSR